MKQNLKIQTVAGSTKQMTMQDQRPDKKYSKCRQIQLLYQFHSTIHDSNAEATYPTRLAIYEM